MRSHAPRSLGRCLHRLSSLKGSTCSCVNRLSWLWGCAPKQNFPELRCALWLLPLTCTCTTCLCMICRAGHYTCTPTCEASSQAKQHTSSSGAAAVARPPFDCRCVCVCVRVCVCVCVCVSMIGALQGATAGALCGTPIVCVLSSGRGKHMVLVYKDREAAAVAQQHGHADTHACSVWRIKCLCPLQ